MGVLLGGCCYAMSAAQRRIHGALLFHLRHLLVDNIVQLGLGSRVMVYDGIASEEIWHWIRGILKMMTGPSADQFHFPKGFYLGLVTFLHETDQGKYSKVLANQILCF